MAGLPPSARLRRAADFAALQQGTGRWQGRHFALRWRGTTCLDARLGLAVSRKVSKRAVVRNRVKRNIRESFRAARGDLPVVDVLVIARASAANADNPALRADLTRAWLALKALKPAPTPGTIGG